MGTALQRVRDVHNMTTDFDTSNMTHEIIFGSGISSGLYSPVKLSPSSKKRELMFEKKHRWATWARWESVNSESSTPTTTPKDTLSPSDLSKPLAYAESEIEKYSVSTSVG